MSGFNARALLGRMAVRETARATLEAVERRLDRVQIVGATVRATAPGTGVATVHIDGDPPGNVTQVPIASWELFDVGQRVYVVLFPPSGALLLGPAGAAVPWTPYPYDAPDPPFYSARNKTPTITELNTTGGFNTFTPGTNASSTVSSITLPADSIIVLCVGTRMYSAYKQVGSFTTTGIPLSWTRVGEKTVNADYFAGGNLYLYGGMWWAYNATGQTVNFTINWDTTTTGAKAFVSILACSDALRVQAGGTASATQTGSLDHSTSVTTLANYCQIVGLCVGGDGDYSAGGFNWYAASGCSIVTEDYSFLEDGYSGMCTVKRTSAVTTPGATTIGASGLSVDDADEFGLVIGLEVQGKPDVPVAGDGTIFSSYRVDGKRLAQRLCVVAGSTTTFGGGPLGLHLPPGIRAATTPTGGRQSIGGSMLVGTNEYRVRAVIPSGATYFDRILYQDGSSQFLDSTHPATLGSTFRLDLVGEIEIA